ncbi:receptor-type tyrosine-protein phosphatase mu-like [Babylonia areolata]|uniref:receptor-type tyrosine-protein phosphatase mu-like n=1 Tax=Babylonia areolata TaxID=304850 RepID=UPI003FD631DD
MKVTGLEEEERAHFVVRTFSVGQLQGPDKRQVRQYHYVQWKDHEVPTTTPLIDFWRYVTARAPRSPTAPPLVVHCSAGVGRTGTYIALDVVMEQSQQEDSISVYGTVSSLRDYRCHRRLCQVRTRLAAPSHTAASLEQNQHKNRNPHVLPDDKHLTYITEQVKGRNQYINVVCMPTFLSARGSIVTQLPLPDTVVDLWRLVDSWHVTTIVSLGQV